MKTVQNIHDSAKNSYTWIHAFALRHSALKDTDCMGYSAGCRFAIERVHVEVSAQDTTGMGAVASLDNMMDGRPKDYCQYSAVG